MYILTPTPIDPVCLCAALQCVTTAPPSAPPPAGSLSAAPRARLSVPQSHALLSLCGAWSRGDTRLPTLVYAACSAVDNRSVSAPLRPGPFPGPLPTPSICSWGTGEETQPPQSALLTKRLFVIVHFRSAAACLHMCLVDAMAHTHTHTHTY